MKTKREFKYFTIFHHEKEEEYLRQMHKKGWRFVRVSGFGSYHFEECEPQDVIYQLDYAPQRKKEKEAYVQMFADCGWTYLQDYAGYSYFCKPKDEKGEEAIFSDEVSRSTMVARVLKEDRKSVV